MKTLVLPLFALSVTIHAATVTNLPPKRPAYDASLAAGAHHRFHPITREDPLTGQTIPSGFVELASGLNYLDAQGQWQPTVEQFEIVGGHAVAVRGPHQVILAPNPKTPGAVDLVTPDGKRLRGHVLGLSVYNPATGASELIAEVQDCVGEMVAPNQVLIANAFDSIKASLRYTFTRGGFEQDVILEERPVLPAEFQAPGCRLEVLTEFIDLPEVHSTVHVLKSEQDPQKRATLVEPDLVDEHLDFGEMQIGSGRAFALGGNAIAESIGVGKRLVRTPEGRSVIFEAVELDAAQEQLDKLPQAQAFWMPRPSSPSPQLRAGIPGKPHRGDPESERALASGAIRPRSPIPEFPTSDGPGITRLFAQHEPAPGFVIDWQVVSSIADMVFAGDKTWLINANVTLSGNVVLEGGSVIKVTNNGSGSPTLFLSGTITCNTAAFSPVVFTAVDDNSVGETITGSTGTPSGHYGTHLYPTTPSTVLNLKHVHFRHAFYTLVSQSGSDVIQHCQFIDNKHPFAPYFNTGSLKLRNILVRNSDRIIDSYTYTPTVSVENATFQSYSYLNYNGRPTWASLTVTNSLLIEGTTQGPYSGAFNTVLSSSSGVFQTVGNGAAYLADNSPYRNAGTASIDAGLAADLKKMTTHPPVVIQFNTYLSVDTDWHPIVPRDNDTPDQGYHYSPIDYALCYTYVQAGTKLTVHPGTVLTSQNGIGIRAITGSTVEFRGTADKRIAFVDFRTVQEKSSGWTSQTILMSPELGGTGAHFTARFVDFHSLAGVQYGIYCAAGIDQYNYQTLDVRDCRSFNTHHIFGSISGANHQLANNFFSRGRVYFYDSANLGVYNNTFYRSKVEIYQEGPAAWTFKDNLFDPFSYTYQTMLNVVHGWNAYINSSGQRIGSTANNDVVLNGTFNYATGPLGDFYLNSTGASLVNAGSRTADQAGLYHHTTQTSQVKDANTTVDIGAHHPSTLLDSTGLKGWWQFNDNSGTTALDLSGNGLHGTLTSGPVWASGQFGSAVNFDGVNDYVQIGSSTTLNMTTALTMSAWIYPTNGTGIIVNKEGEYEWAILNGTFQWALANTYPGWTFVDTGFAPPPFQWSHVAFTYESGSAKTYINGTLFHTFAATGTIGDTLTSLNDFRIGGRQYLNQFFGGRIDEVQIYNRVLASQEIANLVLGPPLDTDGDGLADYIEDRNGNGTFDTGQGETDWQFNNSQTGGAAGLLVFTPLK